MTIAPPTAPNSSASPAEKAKPKMQYETQSKYKSKVYKVTIELISVYYG